MAKIQVLKCSPVTGKNDRGSYSFHRLACVFFDDRGNPDAVGDLIHDTEVVPGMYPVSFSVASYQGKLTGKILLNLTPVPAAATASK